MSAGNWDEDVFPPDGVTSSETAVSTASMVISSLTDGEKLSGSNVLLIIENGKVKISGHAEVDLSAPKGGGTSRVADVYADQK